MSGFFTIGFVLDDPCDPWPCVWFPTLSDVSPNDIYGWTYPKRQPVLGM